MNREGNGSRIRIGATRSIALLLTGTWLGFESGPGLKLAISRARANAISRASTLTRPRGTAGHKATHNVQWGSSYSPYGFWLFFSTAVAPWGCEPPPPPLFSATFPIAPRCLQLHSTAWLPMGDGWAGRHLIKRLSGASLATHPSCPKVLPNRHIQRLQMHTERVLPATAPCLCHGPCDAFCYHVCFFLGGGAHVAVFLAVWAPFGTNGARSLAVDRGSA